MSQELTARWSCATCRLTFTMTDLAPALPVAILPDTALLQLPTLPGQQRRTLLLACLMIWSGWKGCTISEGWVAEVCEAQQTKAALKEPPTLDPDYQPESILHLRRWLATYCRR